MECLLESFRGVQSEHNQVKRDKLILWLMHARFFSSHSVRHPQSDKLTKGMVGRNWKEDWDMVRCSSYWRMVRQWSKRKLPTAQCRGNTSSNAGFTKINILFLKIIFSVSMESAIYRYSGPQHVLMQVGFVLLWSLISSYCKI